MSQGFRGALVALVGAAWAVSFVASLVNPDYHPDPSVNAAFTLVIGAALYRGATDKNGAGGDK